MKRVEGYAIPLGVQVSEGNVNFAIEVKSGCSCKLNLYSSNETNPTIVYDMPEHSFIKGIRFLGLENYDTELVEYNYEIDGEIQLDPYVWEVSGRKSWGNDVKKEVYGKIINDISESKNDRCPFECQLPCIPEEEVISYRLHVRGFTKHPSSKVKAAGTFAGIIEKIQYFKEIGINQLQLLPSYEFIEEGFKINYWGYAPGYPMAPKSAYSFGESAIEEMKHMIHELHRNGIEVILDMPFIGKYSIMYQIMCLRHYVLYYQVDGFVLNSYSTNIEEMKDDSILQQIKIYQQDEGYQIAMRKFLKGDEGMVRDVSWYLKKPTISDGIRSCNYITNHNGFTMYDVVSYDGKHNETNGEKNQDGNDYNYSWNCGVEGVTRRKLVTELRKKQIRNAWTLLILSQGTPCILAGDEFGNSQMGNNNPYCQDNEISWIDWRLKNKQKELFEFVAKLIRLRKQYPVLRQKSLVQGMDTSSCGIPDVSYHGSQAWIMPEEVASRQLGVLYSGSKGNGVDCYLAYNMHWEPHDFALPNINKKKKWYQVLDTSTGIIEDSSMSIVSNTVEVKERSITMYICK